MADGHGADLGLYDRLLTIASEVGLDCQLAYVNDRWILKVRDSDGELLAKSTSPHPAPHGIRYAAQECWKGLRKSGRF